MNLLLISGIVLIFIVVDFIVYIYLKRWHDSKLQSLQEKEESLNEYYQSQVDDIEDLKKTERKLQNQLYELKAQKKESEREKSQSSAPKPSRPEQVLLQENIISEEQINKAKKYLENNQQAWMDVIDILMILGFIDLETVNYAKTKCSQQV
jgi:seryl-tRNA synthetase